MANYQFTADLINDVLFRARETQSGSSDWQAALLSYLNRAYQSLWYSGQEFTPTAQIDWYWLRKHPPGTFTLNPVYDTGTASVAPGNASVTLSVAPSISLQGRFFKASTHPDVFRVLTHTAASTALVLSSPYTGPVNGVAAFTATQLEYDLPTDCIRIIDDLKIFQTGRVFNQWHIPLGDVGAMEREYPVALLETGPPNQAGYVTETKIRFNRGGGTNGATDFIRVEFDYLARPALLTAPGLTEEPVVPMDHRKVLADMALYYLWVDKNDDRAGEASARAQAGIAAMIRAQWYKQHVGDDDFGMILPREASGSAFGPLRTESGFLLG